MIEPLPKSWARYYFRKRPDSSVNQVVPGRLRNVARGYQKRDLSELSRLIHSPEVRAASGRVRSPLAGGSEQSKLSQDQAYVSLHSPDSSVYFVGQMLADLDREMRRSTTWLLEERLALPRRPADLQIKSSIHSESHDFLLVAGGQIVNLLQSSPVQFGITLSWFWDHRPKRWGIRTPTLPPETSTIVRRLTRSANRARRHGGSAWFHLEVAPDGHLVVDYVTVPPGEIPQ